MNAYDEIDQLFNAGFRQAEIDESDGKKTECPYPEGSRSRHWYTRGYAHLHRMLRAKEAEAKAEGLTTAVREALEVTHKYNSCPVLTIEQANSAFQMIGQILQAAPWIDLKEFA